MIEIKNIKIICLFFSLLCVGCSKNENSYFPLTKGYKWQYDVALTTQDGLQKQKYIFNNLGKGDLNGVSVYMRESLDGSVLYYSISDDGIYYLGNRDSQSIHPEFNEDKQLVLPEELSVGTEWEYTTITRLLKKTGPPQKTEFKILAEVPLEIKIESLNETVIVPAGRFINCMKISMSGFAFKDAGNYIGLTMVSVKQMNWYASGIGLVKMERLETTERKALDKGSLLIELAKFESG